METYFLILTSSVYCTYNSWKKLDSQNSYIVKGNTNMVKGNIDIVMGHIDMVTGIDMVT